MKSMSDDLYPLTVTAFPCGHSMLVTSKQEQADFEKDHRDRCNAEDFNEQVSSNKLYGR
jgi:hypothetical protein